MSYDVKNNTVGPVVVLMKRYLNSPRHVLLECGKGRVDLESLCNGLGTLSIDFIEP